MLSMSSKMTPVQSNMIHLRRRHTQIRINGDISKGVAFLENWRDCSSINKRAPWNVWPRTPVPDCFHLLVGLLGVQPGPSLCRCHEKTSARPLSDWGGIYSQDPFMAKEVRCWLQPSPCSFMCRTWLNGLSSTGSGSSIVKCTGSAHGLWWHWW